MGRWVGEPARLTETAVGRARFRRDSSNHWPDCRRGGIVIQGEYFECVADIAGRTIPGFIDSAACVAGNWSLKGTWSRKSYRNRCPRGRLQPTLKRRDLERRRLRHPRRPRRLQPPLTRAAFSTLAHLPSRNREMLIICSRTTSLARIRASCWDSWPLSWYSVWVTCASGKRESQDSEPPHLRRPSRLPITLLQRHPTARKIPPQHRRPPLPARRTKRQRRSLLQAGQRHLPPPLRPRRQRQPLLRQVLLLLLHRPRPVRLPILAHLPQPPKMEAMHRLRRRQRHRRKLRRRSRKQLRKSQPIRKRRPRLFQRLLLRSFLLLRSPRKNRPPNRLPRKPRIRSRSERNFCMAAAFRRAVRRGYTT